MFGVILAVALQATVSPYAETANYVELGQVDLSPTAEHCWKSVKDGRVGIGFGLIDSLVLETKWAEFKQAGIEPSIGMRMFARHNASAAYPALVARIDGEIVTVTTDLQLIGSMFVDPVSPVGLYVSDSRMPAITPRVWTNDLTRADLLAIMDCYDKNEALSI